MTPVLKQIVNDRMATQAAEIMRRGRENLGFSYDQTIASLQRIARREGFELDPAAWDELVREANR